MRNAKLFFVKLNFNTKMKQFFVFAVFALLAASCSNENDVTVCNAEDGLRVPVTVRVSDFAVSVDPFEDGGGALTRAAEDVADYANVGAVTLAFYEGSTEVYKTTQLRSETSSFGVFDLWLPLGNYTMVVLGYGFFSGDVLSLTSPTSAVYTSDKVRETFVATQTVNITTTDPVDISATLNRIVSKVVVESTDNRTSGAAYIRTSFSAGGKGFNPSTGLATSNTGFSNQVQGSGSAGNKVTATNFLFLATDAQTMDVTIEVLDASENVLAQRVVKDVPMKRNRATKLKGSIFDVTSLAGAFQVETSWAEADNTVEF